MFGAFLPEEFSIDAKKYQVLAFLALFITRLKFVTKQKETHPYSLVSGARNSSKTE